MNMKLIVMMETVRSFFKREEGASAIEYALVAGLISVVIIVGATAIGEDLSAIMTRVAAAVGVGAEQVATQTPE